MESRLNIMDNIQNNFQELGVVELLSNKIMMDEKDKDNGDGSTNKNHNQDAKTEVSALNAENQHLKLTSANFIETQKKHPSEPNKIEVKQDEFYTKAQKYWSTIPATVNGMLGGLGYVSAIDIQGSKTFLHTFKDLGKNVALDCGAGIGRVSKNLLLPLFECVDLVEQDPAFAAKAMEYCTTGMQEDADFQKRFGKVYNMGLQKFNPDPGKYDLVWSQWVLGHLTDDDLLKFFARMRAGLAKGGFFIMKENVTSSKESENDNEDSSVTRPLKSYENALKKAGFRIIRVTRQQNLPHGLYPVMMIACKSNLHIV